MFSHVTLGIADFERARRFYDPLLATLKLVRIHDNEEEGWIGYARDAFTSPHFYIGRPFDGRPPTVGNGVTMAFEAPDRGVVRQFHEVGLAHGAKDEGAPGPRPYHADFYGCYLRDPDGHKIACVCNAPEQPAAGDRG